MQPQTLQSPHWQVGILSETGASIAFARVKQGEEWIDVLRPTDISDWGNSSNTSSFIMLPWCNRIKDGILRFQGKEYQLRTTKDDGTARHGDTRGRPWKIEEMDNTHIRMSLHSDFFPDMNWPFKFSAWAEYRLEDRDFVWTLALKNEDTQPMPGGFGYHPYFVKHPETALKVECSKYFQLENFMAVTAPVPLNQYEPWDPLYTSNWHAFDFRLMHAIPEMEINHLFTGRVGQGNLAAEYVYAEHPPYVDGSYAGSKLKMEADPIFEQVLVYAPQGKPYFAIEPMTNASDGFNLYDKEIPGSGVFVLQPGEEKSGMVRLKHYSGGTVELAYQHGS